MKIEDLYEGFVIYDVDENFSATRYEYLCSVPTTAKKEDVYYFILINKHSENPERVNRGVMERMLADGIFTREDCLEKQIKKTERQLEFFKKSKK